MENSKICLNWKLFTSRDIERTFIKDPGTAVIQTMREFGWRDLRAIEIPRWKPSMFIIYLFTSMFFFFPNRCSTRSSNLCTRIIRVCTLQFRDAAPAPGSGPRWIIQNITSMFTFVWAFGLLKTAPTCALVRSPTGGRSRFTTYYAIRLCVRVT